MGRSGVDEQAATRDAGAGGPATGRRRGGLTVLLVFALVVFGAGCTPAADRFVVRVLVITMFELETAPWLEHESLPISTPVPGLPTPLRCSPNGLCVATLGQGKANAAASMAAILDDPALELSHAYFLGAGIAGISPGAGTLGSAAWARWIVDWDLGHHLEPSTAPDVPFGYLAYADQHTNVFRLNEALVREAYERTKNLPLADDPAAVANRSRYPGQAGRTPTTLMCDTVTGDDYWTGAELSREARYITGIWTRNQGTYCTTQMEDSATATVLNRHGYLDRYLNLRTASDFDQPYPGQRPQDALASFPGAGPAVANAYTVGSTVARYLLTRSTPG